MSGESSTFTKGFGKYASNSSGFRIGTVRGCGFGGSAGGMSMTGDDAKQGMQFKIGDLPAATNVFGHDSGIWGRKSPSESSSLGRGSQPASFAPVQGFSAPKSDAGGLPSIFGRTSDTSGSNLLLPRRDSFFPCEPAVVSGFTEGAFTFNTPLDCTNSSNVPAIGGTGKAVPPASGFTFIGASGTSSCVSNNSAFRSGSGGVNPSGVWPGGGSKTEPYQPTPVVDDFGKNTALILQSISAMHDYQSKSHEELSWEDYQCSRGYRRAESVVHPNKMIGGNSCHWLPAWNNMSCTKQLFSPVPVQSPTFTSPNVHNAKGFGTFTAPSTAFTTKLTATQPDFTFKLAVMPQPATVTIPTTPFPMIPSSYAQSPPSFPCVMECAKPAKEPIVLLCRDPLQTSQGATFPATLQDAASTLSKPDFNQISLIFSPEDVQLANNGNAQPAVIANPFGTQRETSLMSLLHSKSSSLVQQGISGIPMFRNSPSVKTASLLTCRHVSRSRIKLPARKPPLINDDPKMPFFYSHDEYPRASKGHSWITATESPKACVGSPALVSSPTSNPDTTSDVNSEGTSGINPGSLNDRDAKVANSVTVGLGMLKIQDGKPNVQNYSNNTIIGQTSEEYETTQLPNLQQSDYYTEPSMEELAAKEKADPGFLSRVTDFVVGRLGYGDVKFLGETDVRRLDITSILQFNHRELSIYPDETAKPPIGQGLNKPAEITLLNVKAINKKSGRQYSHGKKADKYKVMLIQKAKDSGAEFISYDPVNGEWKFRVTHFSFN